MTEKRITSFNINRVFLVLGNACNFNCPHCVQHESHPRIKKQVTPKVINYLKNLADSRPAAWKPNLTFFGGEPLLYKSTMRDVVTALGNRFNYSIISNGSLLTDTDVEWINQNNILFVFSNDGFYTKCTRDLNMFDDPEFVKRFNLIKRRCVEGVFHAYNTNVYKFWDYIQKIAPDTAIVLDDLICSGSVPETYQAYDIAELQAMFNQIKADHIKFFNQEIEKNAAIDYLYQKIRMIDRGRVTDGTPTCGTCRTMLNIDTAGNVYVCHNSDEIIGTIDDDIILLNQRGEASIKQKMQSLINARDCKNCSVFGYCRGGCPMEDPRKNSQPLCDLRKIQWKTAEECYSEIQKLKD